MLRSPSKNFEPSSSLLVPGIYPETFADFLFIIFSVCNCNPFKLKTRGVSLNGTQTILFQPLFSERIYSVKFKMETLDSSRHILAVQLSGFSERRIVQSKTVPSLIKLNCYPVKVALVLLI